MIRSSALIRSIFLALMSAVLLACSSGSTVIAPPSVSAVTTAAEATSGRPYLSRTFTTSTAVDRHYLLRLPAGFEASSCADVIFDFHGAGSSAEGEFNYSGFADLADREGVILVHPDANKLYVDQQHKLASYWNSAWEANLRERDYDIDFILELVAALRSEFCTQSFYATGMSAGGDMVSALACLSATPFESFAAVTYRYYNTPECGAAAPRPIISFQGDADQVVPIAGYGDPWFDPPMIEVMARWATHNQCDAGPISERVGSEVMHYRWQRCEADTEWYLIEGGGHTWPGGNPSTRGRHVTQQISATELIWAFFKR